MAEHLKSDRRRARRRMYTVVAVALLAVGGAAGLMALAGHIALASRSGTGPAAARASAAQRGAGGTDAAGPRAPTSGAAARRVQAAMLTAALNAPGTRGVLMAATPSLANGTQAGAPVFGRLAWRCHRAHQAARAARAAGMPRLARAVRAAAGRCLAFRRRVFRFFLLHGVDGKFTLQTPGGPKTLAFTRGVIESAAGTSLVVRAGNGATWTWNLVAATVVRDRAGKVPAGALTAGEPVWVGGPVRHGTNDARLIVIRPPS